MLPVRAIGRFVQIARGDRHNAAASTAVVEIGVILIRNRLKLVGVAALVCTVASKLIEEAVELT